ncbi:MAG: WYL domain-containing protein [Actinomycetes bacterium]
MANDLELLIEMLPWMVANNGASLQQVATQFEITDKYALELIGQLVVTGPSQNGGGLVDIDFEDAESIFVSDAKSLDRPIKFTSLEAATLLGGLHYLEQFPNLADSQIVAGLITKIQSLLPSLESPISVITTPISSDVHEVLATSITNKHAVQISYAALSKDDVSHRLVDPVQLYVRDDFTYLQAWCRSSQAWRNFRLDRIMEATQSNEPLEVPADPVETEATRDYLAVIVLDKAYYGQLDQVDIVSFKEYMWHAVEVQLKVYSRDWLISMILASRGRMRAIGPPDLIQGLVERAKGWE